MEADKSAPRLDDDNPWPGLAAYDEASTRFFHGREADSAELLRLIRLSPFVVLYGKSGLGKSSMLQAGVFPELRAARFLPVYLRLDYSETANLPLLEQAKAVLLQEIDHAGADAPRPAADESLWAYLQRRAWPIWTRDNFPVTPVLVFDQFEELFSRGASAAHVSKVLESLADLVGDRLPAPLAGKREAVRQLNLQAQQYRVVLSFRSDFLAEVEAWEKQANLPRRESLHLTAMSRQSAIDAVQDAGKAVLEPGVAGQIVDFLLSRDGEAAKRRVTEVEPVLLSLCCYQLNLLRKRPAKIDAALLKGVGEDILKSFYKDSLKGMAPRVAVFIEENLILGERYRNSYPREAALAPDHLTLDELNALTQRRLLRVDPQGGEPRVELIHDRLVGVVRDARDERRAQEALQQERERAEQTVREEREQADQKARAERERERLAQAESERARLARWRVGLVVAVLMLMVLTGGLIWSRNELGKALAEAERLSKEAIRASDEANARADEAARARSDVSDELATIKAAIVQAARQSAPGGDAPAVAAVGAALQTVVNAEQKLQASALAAPEPVPAPARPPSPAPNAAGIAPAPAPAAAPASPNALTLDWRLSSGGCLKGDVTVTGDARFWIEEAAGNQVIVRQEFLGTGNRFNVKVADTRKPVARTSRGYYDVETEGEWSGPGGRQFKSTGVDRVFVKDGATPIRANVLSFRTVCPR
jgi:hypothetical protein